MKLYSLKSYNTFGVECFASKIIPIRGEEDLLIVEEEIQNGYKILGGGSNILLTGNIALPILKNEIKGIEILKETHEFVTVKIGSGENWHQVVEWALSNNFGGIENLSLIPGSVGAAPVQNIGAYGVEIKDVLIQVEGIFIIEKKRQIFSNSDCEFSYRNSLFKSKLKEQFFITYLVLKLSKNHKLHIDYGAIQSELKAIQITSPSIQDISAVVIKIRNSKLPIPSELGNAGSFFKNSFIEKIEFENLRLKFPDIPGYKDESGLIKIPSGWLIEQCGWKGKRRGDVGCFEKQALVIVNYGSSTGSEIWNFSKEISQSVYDNFGIHLVPEVNIW